MKKALLVFSVLALMFTACNNATKTTEKTDEGLTQSEVSVDSFLVVAEDFLGKEITVYGTVDHVCKHGGKRVKMFTASPDAMIHAEAGEEMGAFNAEVEGSDIAVTGIVAENRMDLAYVEEYEQSIKDAMAAEEAEADMEHEKGVDHHATLDKIAQWKEEIATNGKGYISTYYLEALKYNDYKGDGTEVVVKKTEDSKPCGHENDEEHAEHHE